MATGVYWNGNISARQTEHVITYTPNETVKPTVVFGDTLYGRSTMDYLADWTQKHGKTIVAGINGSFFSMTNGVPIETLSKMLGHTNIRTTQIYAKITHEKESRDMAALSDKLSKIEQFNGITI